MKNRLSCLLIAVLWLFGTGYARGQIISGPTTVCAGYSATYTYTAHPITGATYTWRINPLYGIKLSTGSSAAATILWEYVGATTITVVRDIAGTPIDSGTINLQIVPQPQPFITTTKRIACQSFDTTKKNPTPPLIVTDSVCTKVCDSSAVTYYANGGSATDKHHWIVTDGQIIGSADSPSVTVWWTGSSTAGAIQLSDTSAGGCYAITKGCVQLIPKPSSAFTIGNRVIPVAYDTVCYNTQVFFQDMSKVDPTSSIVSYKWLFGDDSTSSLQNPYHTFLNAGITDTVRLITTNACGCTDTFTTFVYINSGHGPAIQCVSVKCQGDTANYYTPDVCAGAHYHWSVSQGDSITSYSPDSSSIVVKWVAAVAGYGTISLWESSCASLCTGVTTVKVPIVVKYPPITGPPVMCTHKPQQYSVPLCPGCQYYWGVPGHPYALVSGRKSNVVAVQFDTAGTYSLHLSYKNSITLCGGDTTFSVTVYDPPVVSGNTISCSSSTPSYSLSGSYTGNWTLSGPGGYTRTGTGHNFIAIFSGGGTYTLTVSGSGFCSPDPYIINVMARPQPVNHIIGKTSVCLGRPYQYKATEDVPGSTYIWHVSAGGITHDQYGDSITVAWNLSMNTIDVARISLDSPYCLSNDTSLVVQQKNFHPFLTGDSLVCSETDHLYNDNAPDSDLSYVKWSINPPTAGSIISGSEGPMVDIHWHKNRYPYITDTATISCVVQQCALTNTVTEQVAILAPPFIAFGISNSQVCDSTTIFLNIDTSARKTSAPYWIWDYGDGSKPDTVTGLTTSHLYVEPAGWFEEHHLGVTADVTDGVCPATWTSQWDDVGIRSATVSIFTKDTLKYCGSATVSDTLKAIAADGLTSTFDWFFWWYKNGVIVDSGDRAHMNYIATDTGSYYVIFTDSYSGVGGNCRYTSNIIRIVNVGACGGGGSCPGVVSATFTNKCSGVVFADATSSGTSTHWTAIGGRVLSPNSDTTTIIYNAPGYYGITLSQFFDSCTASKTFTDSVVFIPGATAEVNHNVSCTSPQYSVNAYDNSLWMLDWTLDSTNYTITNIATGTTYKTPMYTFYRQLPAGTYVLTDQVAVQQGSTILSCPTQPDTFVIPQMISSITINANPLSICEGIPTQFSYSYTPSTANFKTLQWIFNDTSYSALDSPLKTLTWDVRYAPSPSSNLAIYTSTIQLIDQMGCIVEGTRNDTIYKNIRNDGIYGDTIECPGKADTLRTSFLSGYSPITGYKWSDGSTSSIDVPAVSGIYTVTVYDTFQCWHKSPSLDVTLINSIDLNIRGRNSYCAGETVALACINYTGYTYKWYRDGRLFATGNSMKDAGAGLGSHVYYVIASNSPYGCSDDTSGRDTVVIHKLPAAPQVTRVRSISCPQYELELTANDTGSEGGFKYNWSNGWYGKKDTVFAGGAYRVFATDTFGCTSYADTLLPFDPKTYLQWFPTGCYGICRQSLEDSLYGPPGSFTSWSWLNGGGTVMGGGNSSIRPLGLFLNGNYQLAVANSFCSATSDFMDESLQNCNTGCPAIQSASFSCDNATPGGYILTLSIASPAPSGKTVSVGVDIGPVVPFTYTYGSPVTLHFTTLHMPAPTSALVEIKFTNSVGQPCYDTFRAFLPSCSWVAEKSTADSTITDDGHAQIATGMLVYPNPADNGVSVNYNYGYIGDADRRIILYDVLGRTIAMQKVQNQYGTINLSIRELVPGSYIVRMEENGRTIHAEHLSIKH